MHESTQNEKKIMKEAYHDDVFLLMQNTKGIHNMQLLWCIMYIMAFFLHIRQYFPCIFLRY